MAEKPNGPGTARRTALTAVRTPSAATILAFNPPEPLTILLMTAPSESTISVTNISSASCPCANPVACGTP